MIIQEDRVVSEFLENGFVIVDLDDSSFKSASDLLASMFKEELKPDGSVAEDFNFSMIHKCLESSVNDLRLSIFNQMNDQKINMDLFNCASPYLEKLVGNELAIQSRANLSIQLPEDDTSLLGVHSDVLAGNSPFEVVLWVPFNEEVKASMSFKILPLKYSRKYWSDDFVNIDNLLEAESSNFIWPHLKKGQGIIFLHHLFHGNEVNKTDFTRVSINLRFKSLMSPYGEKSLYEYFEPLNIKPVTSLALGYMK